MKMKLYLYDHCPFCVRADMVANYKRVDHEKVYLLNDDEKTCIDLVGAKMLPILEDESGHAMGESLDIAKKLDKIGASEQTIREEYGTKKVTDQFATASYSINCLLFPRNIQIGLPEFATDAACSYFRNKKEEIIDQSFDHAFANTAEHKAKVEAMLVQVSGLEYPSEHHGQISWSDVIIYPTLRNLTMVKDLVIPESVLRYIQEVAEVTDTMCYFEDAI
jgi:glutaredoxin 2